MLILEIFDLKDFFTYLDQTTSALPYHLRKLQQVLMNLLGFIFHAQGRSA